MREYLQTWYDAWLKQHRDTNLIYAKHGDDVRLSQVHFVRDYLSGLVWSDVKYDDRATEPERSDCKVTAMVIGEHRSKSVRLPVFAFDRPDLGIQIILRDNYYNWNISVIAERPIACDLRGFPTDFSSAKERAEYQPRGYWGYCFFEGFPTVLMFGPHAIDQRKFSLWVNGDYEAYAFVRTLMLGVRQ